MTIIIKRSYMQSGLMTNVMQLYSLMTVMKAGTCSLLPRSLWIGLVSVCLLTQNYRVKIG